MRKLKMRAAVSFCVVLLCVFGGLTCSSLDNSPITDFDTGLFSLEIGELDLLPLFDTDTKVYTASAVLPGANAAIFIKAVCNNPEAVLKINGEIKAQNVLHEMPVESGANNFDIVVEAGSRSFTRTGAYSLTFTRVGVNDAHLSALIPSDGVLSPAFGRSFTEYDIAVPYSVSNISFTPMAAAGASATIEIGGVQVPSGQESGKFTLNTPIPLVPSTNTYLITVTAVDGTDKVYTVHVVRAAPRTGNDINAFRLIDLPGGQRTYDCTLTGTKITGHVLSNRSPDISNTNAVFVPIEDPLKQIKTYIEVSPGATVVPASGAAVDFSDGDNTLAYTVTSESGVQQTYHVTVTAKEAYPIFAVLTGAGDVYAGGVLDIGIAFIGEEKQVSLTVTNIGYTNLHISSCAFGGGWGLKAPLYGSIPIGGSRKIVLANNFTAGTPAAGTFTVSYNSYAGETFTLTLNATPREMAVNNLFITEWARAGTPNAAGTGLSASTGDGYIELRNFSSSTIVIDDKVRIRSNSGKEYRLVSYGEFSWGGAAALLTTRYKPFSTQPLELVPGQRMILVGRGANGKTDPKFFDYSFAAGLLPETICVFARCYNTNDNDKEYTSGAFVDNAERLKTNYAELIRENVKWGKTPELGSSIAGSTGTFTVLLNTFNWTEEDAAGTGAHWSACGNTVNKQPTVGQVGQWPKYKY